MIIPIITDTHFGVSKDDDFFMQHQFRFIENVFFPYLQKNEIKTIFHLGDFWDKRKLLNINTLNIVCERFFKPLHDMGVTLYIFVGNHDVYYKNTNKVNSLQFLTAMYDNIVFVDDFCDVTVGNKTFSFFPWINNGNYDDALKFIETSKGSVACGHFETKGFEMTRGQFADSGIDKNLFKKYDRVFSGHFHIPSKQGNFEYIGNPFYLSWADWDTRKSFTLYDTEKNTVAYVLNEDFIYQRVNYADIESVHTFDYSKYKDKIVECVVNDFEVSNKVEFRVFVETMQQMCYSFDIVVARDISVSAKIEESVKIDAAGQVDTETTITSCVESLDVGGLDATRLKNMIQNLFKRATNE